MIAAALPATPAGPPRAARAADRARRPRLFPARRGRSVGLGVLLLLWPGAAHAADRAAHWSFVARGVGQLVDGDLSAAVGTLARARAADPAAAALVDTFVGLAALAGGRVEDARRQFERAIGRGSAEPLLYYWAARAELHAGRLAEALDHLSRALAIGRDRVSLWIADALIARAAGHRALAVGALGEAAVRWPNLLDPRLYPTPVEGAVDLLARALHDLPDPLRLWRLQAHLYWRLEQVPGARRLLAQLLARRPDDSDALQLAARCALALGQTDEALRLSTSAVKSQLGPTAQALATHGLVLAAAGRGAEALPWLQRAADARPRDVELLVRLAETCAAAEQADCARRYFAWAVRLDPHNGAAQLGLGLEHLQQGRLDAARPALASALRSSAGDPRVYEAAAQLERRGGGAAAATTRLLRAAARARSVVRRLEARVRVAAEAGRAMEAALEACGCVEGRCASRGASCCYRAASRVPGLAGQFLRRHLRLIPVPLSHAMADPALGDRLTIGLLTSAAPRVLWAEGRGLDGLRYRLRRSIAWVPPQNLERAHSLGN